MKLPFNLKTATHSYTVTKQIGEGGAGAVYAAKDDQNMPCALKLLKKEALTEEKLKRFHRELKFGHSNDHPNILRVIDSNADSDS